VFIWASYGDAVLRERHLERNVIVILVMLAAAGGIGVALWPAHGGSPNGGTAVLATVSRGDVVLSVGGVGRVVAAWASGQISVPAATTAASASSTAPTAPTTAPAGSVFPTGAGRVERLLVAPGGRVRAGQAIAVLDDGGATGAAIEQARSDLAAARLELQQKRTSDPTRGVPPTQAELKAARLALRAATERARLTAHPARADVTSARLDLSRARADLATLARAPGPAALDAARLTVDVAKARLEQATGPATALDVSAARVELAKAQADLDALRATPTAPSATALQAAQLAVTLAEQRIAELPSGSAPSEVTAAQLDLKKAQAELEALQKPAPAASASALNAAQAALDLATQKLAQLTGPPLPLTVASAQLDLLKAQADLETLRRAALPSALEAGRLAVRLARQRLAQIVHPTAAARDAGQADVAKAAADLQTLALRGAPASAIDISIAGLKVQAARAKLTAAEMQARGLTVRTPTGGTVTAVLAVRGAPADPTTPIATIADLGHLAVTVDLSEFDVARVHRGQPAILSVDALGGRELAGRVEFVALTGVDNGGVVTFPARVTLNRPGLVKPGMNVSVRIIVAERRNVVRVPLEAVVGHTVTVVDAGARRSVHVRLGLADNKQVEVRSGLQAGERVVVGPQGG